MVCDASQIVIRLDRAADVAEGWRVRAAFLYHFGEKREAGR
jgi:hypothetical protein